MESPASTKTVTTIVAILALAQSAFGVLRALHWFNVGTDFIGQGVLLLPLIGVVTIFRGLLVAIIALLYVLFACGILLKRAWGWWLGVVAAGVNLLLVFNVLAQGEPVGRALLWVVVPLIILLYLFSTAGRHAPSGDALNVGRKA